MRRDARRADIDVVLAFVSAVLLQSIIQGHVGLNILPEIKRGYSWLLEPLSHRDEGRVGEFVHRFPFVIFGTLAVVGVVLDAALYRSFQQSFFVWTAIALVASLVAEWLMRPSRRALFGRYDRRGLALGLCTGVTWSCLFAVIHARSEHSFQSASIVAKLSTTEQPVVVRGVLCKPVSLRRNPLFGRGWSADVPPLQSQLTLSLQQIRDVDRFVPMSGNALVYVDGDLSEIRHGAILEVYGWLRPLSAPTNPGEPDLRKIDRLRQIHARIETENSSAVSVLKRSKRPLAALMSSISNHGRETLLRHTDDETGSLAVALVMGQREFVDPATRDTLLATGTAHLLSVSGMHLAILVLVATWMISAIGVPTWLRIALILLISLLYVGVTGSRPPVMRAAILISVVLLATCFRRTSQPLNTLGIAAVVLILLNPQHVFATGVHLSFLAVATLMLAGQPIFPGSLRDELSQTTDSVFQSLVEQASHPIVRWSKSALRFVAQMAWLSACVTAVSTPLIWMQFHMVSFVSVATNVLVWAGLMVALPTGVLTVFVEWIHPGLAIIPGALCHLSLKYMSWVIESMADLPGGYAWLPSPPAILVALFYAVLLITLLWRSRRWIWIRGGWFVLWMLSAFACATHTEQLPADTIEATFIDVGHGTSVIVRPDNQRVWLYDCGRLGNLQGTSRHIDTALWNLGITNLDTVFLSHADADHYNAFPALAERFSIERVVTPPGMLSSDPALAGIRSSLSEHGISVVEVGLENADRWFQKDTLQVLHPPGAGIVGNDNANSLVVRLDHRRRSLILPGDLEPPGTSFLLAQSRPLVGGVLMAPHHGSLSMDAEAILSWARPAVTVVSGGKRARRPEVAKMLSAAGSDVYVTADQGAIRVRIGPEGSLQIRAWLTEPW